MVDVFRIGSAEYSFAADTEVAFEDGGMRFALRADGGPGFRSATFYFHDNHDTPQRVSTVPVVWPMVDDFYIWEEGFDFGVKFFGTVTATPERVEMRGLVRHDHESDENGVPVHIVRHTAPQPVTLRIHTYGSIEEALTVAPERVRRLLVRDWDGRFPDQVLQFTNLEFLSLQQVFPDETESVLPEGIGLLRNLRELHIRSNTVDRLPQRLGELTELEVLAVVYGSLSTLPDTMQTLVNLKQLLLDGNTLTTLPDWVGTLPALELLSVEDNPFTALPATLTAIDTVRLEKKYEALFRDISYRPELTATPAPEQLLARHSPEHVALLTDALERHGLTDFRTALLRHARQTVRIRTTEPDDPPTLGATRIGGAPDLPADLDHPATDGRYWQFYAQLDLAELAPLQTFLPRHGRLYFFGDGQERGDQVRVLYSAAPVTELTTYRFDEDAEFTDDQDEPFAGYRVQADATVSVPNLYLAERRYGQEPDLLALDDDDGDLQGPYQDLQDELTGNTDRSRGAHTLNAFVFTQHESPEDQASLAAGGLPQEWINLLSVDSDYGPGFCFWDAGTFTFTIHQKDLAAGDFSRVQWSLESS